MSDDTLVIVKEIVTEPTPEMVARLFCAMDDGQQAEFFAACHKINEEWRAAWEAGGRRGMFIDGMQWYCIGRRLKERGMDDVATETLMDMAAPLFAHTLAYMRRAAA